MTDSDLPERAERLDEPSLRSDALVGVMAELSAVSLVGGVVARL